MLTPAAKKRRVDTANATLKKPFRSPLLSRTQASTSDAPSLRSSSLLRGQVSVTTGDRDSQSAETTDTQSHEPNSPERKHKSARSLTRSIREPTTQATKGPGSELAALLSSFEKELDRDAKEIQQRKELIAQAEQIKAESERRRPGEAVDAELQDLIQKWKAAARSAADEVFGIVKERVAGAGGMKAWREMERRQREFFGGGGSFDNEPGESKGAARDSGDELDASDGVTSAAATRDEDHEGDSDEASL